MIKHRFLAREFTRGRPRFLGLCASTSQKVLVSGLSISVLLAGAALLAPSASASEADRTTITLNGGMVRAGSGVAQQEKAIAAAENVPPCASITFVGNSGAISVQQNSGRLQWGITMTPLSLSIGTWQVSTYLSGQKTSSGFNKTVTSPYIPHGSLSVPPGKIFTVSATVTGPGGTFVNAPNACRTSSATSPSIAAVAGSGYVEAFQSDTGVLCNRTESGVYACTGLQMMAGTSPSITGLAGGGYVEAYQNPQGYLCNRLESGVQACTNLQMMEGTSPSIAGTADGGYTEAFQASTGILWNRNNNGTAATTSLGMDNSSSPSITALAGGGYVEAFQNPQHNLCNRLETGTQACTSLGMMAGTSPSIAGTANGGYTEAFQASTGILWNRNNNGTAATTSLGMM
jgi:hypothetical protein